MRRMNFEERVILGRVGLFAVVEEGDELVFALLDVREGRP